MNKVILTKRDLNEIKEPIILKTHFSHTLGWIADNDELDLVVIGDTFKELKLNAINSLMGNISLTLMLNENIPEKRKKEIAKLRKRMEKYIDYSLVNEDEYISRY